MLNKKVLVLNKSWIPINVTTANRAICLVYTGLAKVVNQKTYETFDFDRWLNQEAEHYVHSVKLTIPVPEVITLVHYNQTRMRLRVPFSRTNLLRRDDYTCQYCCKKSKAGKLTIDHVVPRSKGGVTSWANCVVACDTCNRRKGSRALHEVGYSLSRQPSTPSWRIDYSSWGNEAWETFTGGKSKKTKD